MTGYCEFNFPEFVGAASVLRLMGHEVFCPAEHDMESGFDPTGLSGSVWEMQEAGFSLRKALGVDLAWITANAEALVALSGWGKSKGALAEVATAQAIGIPVWEYSRFLRFGHKAPKVELVVGQLGVACV
jgi:hypothetical protein